MNKDLRAIKERSEKIVAFSPERMDTTADSDHSFFIH